MAWGARNSARAYCVPPTVHPAVRARMVHVHMVLGGATSQKLGCSGIRDMTTAYISG